MFNKEFIIEKNVLIKYNEIEGKTDVVIPNRVTKIADRAFSYCRKLVTIAIPNTVKEIDDEAFSNCPSLTKIMIPNTVKKNR